jgi:hypothetical protein
VIHAHQSTLDKEADMSKHTKAYNNLNEIVDAAHDFLALPLESIEKWEKRFDKQGTLLMSGTTEDARFVEFQDRMLEHPAPEELKAVAYLWAVHHTSREIM